jgi:hypothetical protein
MSKRSSRTRKTCVACSATSLAVQGMPSLRLETASLVSPRPNLIAPTPDLILMDIQMPVIAATKPRSHAANKSRSRSQVDTDPCD